MGGEVLWVAANYYHNRERNKKDRFTSRRKRMQWQVPRARSNLNPFHELQYLPIALTQTYHLFPSASPLSSQFSFIEKGAKRSSTGQPIGFLMLN